MKTIISTILLAVFFIGCSGTRPSTPKIIKTLDANTTDELKLIEVVKHKDINTTKQLLESGVNPNIKEKKFSSLHIALLEKDYDIAKLLLEHGANPNQYVKTKKFNIPLFAVTNKFDDQKFLKLFLEYGANANELDSFYTLSAAISKNKLENIDLLVEKGFDIHATNDDNITLLNYAIMSKKPYKTIKYLIDKKIDVNKVSKRNKTALLYSIDKNSDPKVTKLLLDAGADINFKNSLGSNALSLAIMNSNEEALKLLIEYGANITEKLYGTAVPLVLAIQYEEYKCAKIIADALKVKDERYVLVSLMHGDHKMFNFLHDNGFKVTKRDLDRRYLNMYVVNNRYKELKEYLGIKGLDTIDLKYTPQKTKDMVVKIMGELVDKNTLSPKQKNTIAKELSRIHEDDLAYKWLNTIESKDIDPKQKCFISANIGKTDVEACKKILPTYKENYAGKSWVHLLLEEYEMAIAMGTKAAESKTYFAYANLGHAHLLRGDKKQAYEAYKNYFEKTESVDALDAIKGDFEMLNKNYPEKKKMFDDAYGYCLGVDGDVFGDMVKFRD